MPLHEQVIHQPPKNMADKLAAGLVKLARTMFDVVSGYKHKPLPPDYKQWPIQKLRDEGYILDDRAWLRVSLTLSNAVTHIHEGPFPGKEDSFP